MLVFSESRLRGRCEPKLPRDRTRIFAAFKQLGQQPELELTQKLGRLLMNFSKLASYRGVLEGYHLFQTGIKLGEDRARFYLVEYLQTHPDAENSELIRYLDRKNGKLSALKTNQNDPLWAWLPRSWNEEFRGRGIAVHPGEFWEDALKHFPELVMPYLSRAKKMAKQPRVAERAVLVAADHQGAPAAPEERGVQIDPSSR